MTDQSRPRSPMTRFEGNEPPRNHTEAGLGGRRALISGESRCALGAPPAANVGVPAR
ncbi:hypothetical protein [Okibacterium endophyticum]